MEENELQEKEPEQEIKDLSKPDFVFVPKSRHEWKQQGYYLECHGCELQHGIYIGSEKLMIGENEDGTPILRSRV